MNPLQSVPAKARAIAYWGSYVLSIVLGAVSAGWAVVAANSPGVNMPQWVLVVIAVAFFVQGQLNQMAGSNVTPDEPTEGSLGKALVSAREQAGALRGIVEQVGAVASHMETLTKIAAEPEPVAAKPAPAGAAAD